MKSFREPDHPLETRFDRIRLRVHVVAVQQVARLGSEAFPGCNALRLDSQRPACHQQLVPDPWREVAGDHDLVASFTGVPGAADDAGHLGVAGVDARLRQPVVLEGGEIRSRNPLQRFARFRSLQRKQRRVGRDVAHLHVHALRVLEHPLVVLVGLRDVDDPDEMIGLPAGSRRGRR
jgi:hypothetical protein